MLEKGEKKCPWQGCAVLGLLLAIFLLFVLFRCAFGIKILKDMFSKICWLNKKYKSSWPCWHSFHPADIKISSACKKRGRKRKLTQSKHGNHSLCWLPCNLVLHQARMKLSQEADYSKCKPCSAVGQSHSAMNRVVMCCKNLLWSSLAATLCAYILLQKHVKESPKG